MTVWLVRIWTYKNAVEKGHTFSRRSTNVQKRTKNGYCVNPPLLKEKVLALLHLPFRESIENLAQI